jgi:YgiT-type zinc finger domain-containing protein
MGRQFQEEEEDMNCMYCKGKMERGKAPFQITRKGYHLTFDSVPAWVCGQCGEVYFEESEVEAIQDVLRTLDEQAKKLSVPV